MYGILNILVLFENNHKYSKQQHKIILFLIIMIYHQMIVLMTNHTPHTHQKNLMITKMTPTSKTTTTDEFGTMVLLQVM